MKAGLLFGAETQQEGYFQWFYKIWQSLTIVIFFLQIILATSMKMGNNYSIPSFSTATAAATTITIITTR